MAERSAQSLKRQVDAILASLDDSIEGDNADAMDIALPPLPSTAAPTAAPPVETAATSPPPAASPFSLAAGPRLGSRPSFTRSGSSASAVIPAAPPAAAVVSMSLEQLEAMVAAPETAPMPCKPYDVPAYLGRIATYRSAADWFDKPAAIAPPVCARFGWSLAGHDLLSCGVCGAFLKAPAQLTAVDPAEEGEGADGPTATFARQLSSGHGDLCPWKGNASPQSIGALLLPGSLGMLPSLPHGTSISKEAVRKRAASLLGLPSLPALAPAAEALWAECAAACGFQEGGDAAAVGAWQDAVIQLAEFDRALATLSPHERQRRRVASSLAVLGWEAGKTLDTLTCAEDARTVGLWSYEALARGPTGGAAATGGGAADTKPPFDPVAEHRPWSPWLAVCEGDHLPAWMRYVVLLLEATPSASQGSRGGAAKGSDASGGAATSAAVSRLLSAF